MQSNNVGLIEFKNDFLPLNLTVILQRRVSCDLNEMIPNKVQAAYEETTRIIVTNIYVTLATSSLSGQPHISPVYFSFDNNLRLFWASATESKHSKLIKKNPFVSVVIFDSTVPERTGNGVYMTGLAEEYQGLDLDQIVQSHSARVGKVATKSSVDYLGASPRRIYCFAPTQVWTLTEPCEVSGHLIDTKIELELAHVQNELRLHLSVAR